MHTMSIFIQLKKNLKRMKKMKCVQKQDFNTTKIRQGEEKKSVVSEVAIIAAVEENHDSFARYHTGVALSVHGSERMRGKREGE